jgi:hypothetical protein
MWSRLESTTPNCVYVTYVVMLFKILNDATLCIMSDAVKFNFDHKIERIMLQLSFMGLIDS